MRYITRRQFLRAAALGALSAAAARPHSHAGHAHTRVAGESGEWTMGCGCFAF